MSKLTIIVTKFRSFPRGTLCGVCTAYVAEMHLTIYDLAVHRHASGAHWVQLPAKPMVDADGTLRRTDAGWIEYAQILGFDSREVREAFSKAVIAALLRFNPNVFDDSAA